jgi:hypothetical protein
MRLTGPSRGLKRPSRTKRVRLELAPCAHLGLRIPSTCSSPVHECNYFNGPCRPSGGGCVKFAHYPKCGSGCEGYSAK